MKELVFLLRTRDWTGLLSAPTENSVLQLFRYVLIGGSSFAIDFGIYCILGEIGINYLIAGILAFIISFLFNFSVSRVLIFKSSASQKAIAKEFVGVIVISIIGLGFTELLLFLGTDLLHADFRISKIMASIFVLIWNYSARRLFIYRKVNS